MKALDFLKQNRVYEDETIYNSVGEIVGTISQLMEEYAALCQPLVMGSDANKPHCWGKMKWILEYPSGMEPSTSVCRCEHGSLKCKLLTRKSAR